MINRVLYGYEMKNSGKLLLIIAAVLSLYVCVIVSMFDPELMTTLDSFVEVMPELMAAVGMRAGATTLLGFLISYLYGFLLLVFPMVYVILRSNALAAKYVDQGSMAVLLAAPVKRSTIAATQMWVLISGIAILLVYVTGLEILVSHLLFPGELDIPGLLNINAGLVCLHLFIGGICFLFSCAFSETKYALAFGAGIPVVMFVLQMLANAGEKARALRYVTFFTLFQPDGILAGEAYAFAGAGVLLLVGIALYLAAIAIFCRKNLSL